jgi:hypothetical protein
MGEESWEEERFGPGFDDPELDAVFAKTSPADTIAAVLTEARLVLAEVDNPLDAELWASDILGALGSGSAQAKAIAAAAERDGTPEAMAALCALGAVGSPTLRSAAAESIGAPSPGECWCYGDTLGQQEVVTLTFWYGDRGHVVSVLLDRDQGGGIKNVWVGDAAGLLDRTRTVSKQNSGMIFQMITQADARGRMDRAIAAGECPEQPEERASVASTRAILRARVLLMKR